MHNVFMNPYLYNHKEFSLRLEDQLHQEVNSQFNNSNKTLFYRAIKENVGYKEIFMK